MRTSLYLILFCCISHLSFAQDFNTFWQSANTILSQYVEYDKVHYKALEKKPEVLQKTLEIIASIDINRLSVSEKKHSTSMLTTSL